MRERILMIVIIVAVVLGGGYYSFRKLMPPPEAQVTGPQYATETVQRGDISVGVDATGTLNPSRGGSLEVPGGYEKFRTGGTYIIDDILVEEGDAVKKDQVLVRLEAPQLATNIENKEKELRDKKEALADQLNVSVNEVTSVNPARGITLKAPIGGRIVDLQAKEGQELLAGKIAAKVVDDSRFEITANLNPGEFQGISEGQRALLRFSEFNGLVEAVVTDVNPSAMPVKRSELEDAQYAGGQKTADEQYLMVYQITLEGNNPGLVRPGMKAQVGVVKEETEAGEELDATQAAWLRYYAAVEGYTAEKSVLSTADAIVTEVFVHEMETVEEGDPLVSLSGEDARDNIRQDLDEIRELETELAELRAQFNQLEVKAPMDGTVARIEGEVGQALQSPWLGHIYTTSDMQMWVQVDDVDVLLVKQDAPVQVSVAAVAGKTFEGKVTNVSTSGQDENGITRFQVGIQVKGGDELRPGMQAQAHIEAGSAEDVLLVPLEAIFQEDGQSKVEVLQENGVPKVVTVELGLMNDRFAEIKSGLEEGQQVITGSTADLLPSQHIQSEDGLLPGKDNENDGGNGGGGEAPPEGGAREPAPAKEVK